MSSLVTNLIRKVILRESLPDFPYVLGEKLYPADVEREGRIWNVYAATKRVRRDERRLLADNFNHMTYQGWD
jgi:hypothetical protein